MVAPHPPPAPLFAEHPFDLAEELIAALSPATGLLAVAHYFEQQQWIFRGQGDTAWGLRPSAQRPNALARLTPGQVLLPFIDARDHAERELDGIVRFAVLADRAGFLLPGDVPALRDPRLGTAVLDLLHFPPTEYLSLAALAQHYGIPTRLLDWTYKPYVAAYFAAWDCIRNREAPRERLAIWALSTTFVQQVGGGQDPAFHLVSAPSATNPNLHAQGGLFTLVQPRTAATATGELINLDELLVALDRAGDEPVLARQPVPGADPDAHPEGDEDAFNDDDYNLQGARVWPRHRWGAVLHKFTLPVRESRVLVRLLSDLGVSSATMFPGLQGVADFIMNEKRGHQWAEPGSRSR